VLPARASPRLAVSLAAARLRRVRTPVLERPQATEEPRLRYQLPREPLAIPTQLRQQPQPAEPPKVLMIMEPAVMAERHLLQPRQHPLMVVMYQPVQL